MIVRTAAAAILARSKSDLVVDCIDLPRALAFGQVLVKVEYSGLCATQVHEIDARTGPDRYLPHLLGHEGSGVVVETGPGVTTVEPGDSVVLHWRPGSGMQSAPPSYGWRGERLNAGSVTTFNSYAVVSENRATRVASTLDMRRAPMFGCAITTAFGAVGNEARLRAGESAVVVGVGGVGLAAVHACSLTSAYPIVAVDIHPAKREAAHALGASHFIQVESDATALAAIHDIVGEDGADVVIEASGSESAITLAYAACGSPGRLVLVGVPDPAKQVSLDTFPLHFGKTVLGSNGGCADPNRDIPRLVRLVTHGILSLEGFPVTEHSLADVNSAIDSVRDGAIGRQIIRMHD